jgi:hypothetical protein
VKTKQMHYYLSYGSSSDIQMQDRYEEKTASNFH